MSHLVLLLLQRLDVWLVWASSLCLHPLALAIQLQGSIICLGLALGWAFAAIVRNKELIRIKDGEQSGHSFSFLYSDMNDLEHSVQAKLPRVTIIMPIKGVSEHSESNWRSQLISLYGGPTEFLFVVESKDDPAFKAVSELLLDLQDQVNAKAIVAGFSTTCSQKIHNQLAGISAMHEETKYVLFLDDDVRLHPGTIGALVTCMEQNPKIFILTGYPFDIPSGSLGSYCMFEYHMPCSMGFATGGRTFFLWGGCMMMHADDFRKDRYGMVTGLRHGGYSDDMTLAAVAGANKRLISSPPVAIFFHPLVNNISFSQYWNYLRKQTFVLESYNSYVNWLMNRALFYSHCWLSWSFVLPFAMSAVQLLIFLRHLSGSIYVRHNFHMNGLVFACCHFVCVMIEMASLKHLSRVEIELGNALSPEQKPFSIQSFNWFLVFWALIVDNFLYPVSAVYSHVTQSIDWAGVKYHLRDGKIHRIERKFNESHIESNGDAKAYSSTSKGLLQKHL
ncbi:hypothetical protein KP509_04G090400 [Ceratopteris richardii]|uniref:ceramide glucosyltransferase n=1 Tax=Ceratopteris richardii TaxID=49495 RepID=A0A8T2UV26_CERRI|nr:hypothetical protein KP509_04G090400 [Ceratopteris richardii]